ncbi:MAG TPA: glycine cleavage system protein GcvH [Bacteroidales bacterium]|jgi:glycine cleavage system H protein|nr:glycine cleavage system protein GcvH [Bacteroidales bacterium]MDD4236216.1 glycine cleavage system protein GcvH [Bacteroidales bacterium]MDY0160088.1 glycine cleavage system protein GcvH [Bacteroidales bacterium]HXK82144.1 glycine cleavage system protein GcvH [Bacteroidales bacterium]
MSIPKDLKYTKTHEWIKLEGDEAFVGITEFAASQLGDVVFVEVETIGESLSQGEAYGSIEAVKTVSDTYMPVDGEVLELNPAVEDDPSVVNKDCYGDGWLIKIKVSDASQLDSLLSADEYSEIAND